MPSTNVLRWRRAGERKTPRRRRPMVITPTAKREVVTRRRASTASNFERDLFDTAMEAGHRLSAAFQVRRNSSARGVAPHDEPGLMPADTRASRRCADSSRHHFAPPGRAGMARPRRRRRTPARRGQRTVRPSSSAPTTPRLRLRERQAEPIQREAGDQRMICSSQSGCASLPEIGVALQVPHLGIEEFSHGVTAHDGRGSPAAMSAMPPIGAAPSTGENRRAGGPSASSVERRAATPAARA